MGIQENGENKVMATDYILFLIFPINQLCLLRRLAFDELQKILL